MTTMPYGGVINWQLPGKKSVHDFSVHQGYRHIVAWGVHLGSYAYYIEMQCNRAREMGAPKDSLYLSGADWDPTAVREWRTFSGLRETNPTAASDIEQYVQAIERLESHKRNGGI